MEFYAAVGRRLACGGAGAGAGRRSATAAGDTLEQVRQHLVRLRMPRALELLDDDALRRLETGAIAPLELLETLLAEEIALREGRRVKAGLQTARLTAPKTLAGFDFAFQPSLDRNRILALAQLDFIRRREAVHFVGPPGPAP